MTKIFYVYDFDPMDGSMGRDYLAATYANRADAEAEVTRRNDEWKAYWIKHATDGANRLGETWNWQHARIGEGELK